MYKINDLYDLEHTITKAYLSEFENPWEVLPYIKSIILSIIPSLGSDYYKHSDNVWVHKTATIASTASINGPCIIDENTEVRHCAFIRGSAIIGKNCVVGNSVEVKNSILFDNVQVPHYNYVGDSILGYRAHMGAGALTSNVKSDRSLVVVRLDNGAMETGLKKFGAMLGDNVEVGCNSVLNPGTIIGRNSNIYPLSSVRGTVPANSIYKSSTNIIEKR